LLRRLLWAEKVEEIESTFYQRQVGSGLMDGTLEACRHKTPVAAYFQRAVLSATTESVLGQAVAEHPS
jgi:hypothetical protein